MMWRPIARVPVLPEDLESVFDEIRLSVEQRSKKHGSGAFVGPHETYGVLAEEVDELLEALRKDRNEGFRRELFDVLVAALWGVASCDATAAHQRLEDSDS